MSLLLAEIQQRGQALSVKFQLAWMAPFFLLPDLENKDRWIGGIFWTSVTSGGPGCVLLHPSCLLHISFQLTSFELLRANSRHGVIQIHCRVCSADSTTHANTITMTPSLAQLHILLSKMQQSPCISHDAIHTESIIPNTLHKKLHATTHISSAQDNNDASPGSMCFSCICKNKRCPRVKNGPDSVMALQ